jgi:ABC-type polysaccharide/polyol phosphate export permease
MIDYRAPEPVAFAVFCATSAVVFIAGYWVFHRLKLEFADVL